MSWLSSYLHPERGYQAGQDQLNNYYNQGQGFQQPYNQNGQNQTNMLNDYINSLHDPKKLQDEWSKGYTESEQAKNTQAMAKEHGLDAASSMGLMGSSPALGAIQAGTTQIGLDDRQNYLNDLMQKYMGGAGISQGVYNTGAGAAGQMNTNAQNMGANSAGMQFGKTNAPGQMFGQTVGALGKGAMDWMTGGYGTGDYGRGAWSTGGV